ncbi:MAG: YhcN/YlaJ family sporulation lipoprotein [Syntrophomonadaceae bacterium]|nr:YhcN/YlaJ family sporulation lipoprotein [Syntrophomonadaceae bacterium]
MALKKIMTIILCVLFITTVLVSGCSQNAKKPQPEDTSNSGVQQTSDADNRIMASRFSNLALDVNGVQKATVVVSSTTVANPLNVSSNSNSAATLTPAQSGTTTTSNLSDTNQSGSELSGISSNPGAAADIDPGRLVVLAGLTLNAAAMQDKDQENKVKEEVKTKIMQSDQRVNEVLVTTNPDMIKKLQDVAEGVIQGKPLQNYAQDINELDKSIRSQ